MALQHELLAAWDEQAETDLALAAVHQVVCDKGDDYLLIFDLRHVAGGQRLELVHLRFDRHPVERRRPRSVQDRSWDPPSKSSRPGPSCTDPAEPCFRARPGYPADAAQWRRRAATSASGRSWGKKSLAPATSTTSSAPAMVSRSQYAHLTSKNVSPVPHTMSVGTSRVCSAGSAARRSLGSSAASSPWNFSAAAGVPEPRPGSGTPDSRSPWRTRWRGRWRGRPSAPVRS